MPEPVDRSLRKRAYREYLWFALILLGVLVASVSRQIDTNDPHTHTLADQTLSTTNR